ncbi:glycine-rich protein [Branchiibius cervicis]|uniref:receptor protein-tyrosine kinase n=1 Tax=Branchiibius cervicis TaxID=908252 RepID=A0ABW2ASZ3_9MICO
MKFQKMFLTRTVCSVAAAASLGGVALSLSPSASAATPQEHLGGAPWSQTYDYTGGVQWTTVPSDTDQLSMHAIGGDGGTFGVWPGTEFEGSGAVVDGSIAVTPGQRIAISVGGMGESGGTTSSDPHGGWGGLGLDGGSGNGASDHLRTSAGGGGATVIQIENADGSDLRTIVIAAGGGGDGGASGDICEIGNGGDGGAGWNGQNGQSATDGGVIGGGAAGGKSATQASGSGARGLGGSGFGGNGGGGGGGFAGGGAGSGAVGFNAGGGGASGSSAVEGVMNATISPRYSYDTQQTAANGQVVLTWMYV